MSSKKTWYVQTGFGTVLGPMPTDVLREMVRTGEMVRSDQVRKGSGGRWHPASEIPGLFEPITSADSEQKTAEPPAEPELSSTEQSVLDSIPQQPESPASERTATAEPEPPSTTPSVKGRLIPPPVPFISAIAASPPVTVEQPATVVAESITDLPKVKPLAEPPSNDVSNVQPASQEDDLISRWREERDRTREELGTVSLAAEMTQSEEVEDFSPELPADLLDDESEKPAPKPVSSISESNTRRRTIERPAFLDQVAGLEEGPRVHEESPKQKWDRWRRSLPDLRIAAAVIVVLFAAWWFWPRSSRGIYDRYVAIWDEWTIRRVDVKDPAGWEQFLNRTEKELNATVPYLEKHARASDRESQLLLFIGRDCLQKMLKAPKQIGSPVEDQMQTLFAVLHEMYQPSGDGKRIETVVRPTRTKKAKVRERNRAIEGEADPRRSRPHNEEQLTPGAPKPAAVPTEPNPAQP